MAGNSLTVQKITTFFLRYRYWLLCGLILVMMVSRANNSYWVGDFWEHSSVIRELATHPLNPVHPQILSEAPSAFNTPYHWLLGLAANLSGRSAVETLAVAGLVNLLLYFIGFYLFVSSLDRSNGPGLAFYALLLTLLFWGVYVWNFSGYYHLRILGSIIPYPSMFAMALSLIALWLNSLRIEKKNDWWLLPIWLIASVVLLTHSITFIFLAAGLLAFTLQSGKRFGFELLKIAGFLALAIGTALLWPYYPFLKLLLGETALYHASNRDMYEHLWYRTWPLLIGIPLLFIEARKNWRSPLPWMFIVLLAVYVYGWATASFSYGRVMSYLGVILQITIAVYLLKLELFAGDRFRKAPTGQALFSLIATLALFGLTWNSQIMPFFNTVIPGDGNHLEKYLFLSEYTDQYDVILTDLDSSMIVPTFGGKVVAYARPLPFVADADQRVDDVNRFYDPQTSRAERSEILKKYAVNYILLEKKPEANWEETRRIIAPFSELVYRGKRFLLYRVAEK